MNPVCPMPISPKQRFLMLTLLLVYGVQVTTVNSGVLAAKKYYPPDFTPPLDEKILPETTAPSPAPPVTAPAPGGNEAPAVIRRQTIIKTVPVPVKPPDPLAVMLEEKRYYEALQLVNQRLKKSPRNLELLLIQGQVLAEQNQFESSQEVFRRVLGKSKSPLLRSRAYSGLGMVDLKLALTAQRLGDEPAYTAHLKKAETSFRMALRVSPGTPDGWLGLARLALVQNKLKDAEAALSHVHGMSGAAAYPLLKGQLALMQGKLSQAFTLATQAKAKFPEDPDVYLLMGQVCLALERLDDAIIQFKRVLERRPESPDALKFLSTAYELKMNVHEAEHALQKAVNLNPMDVEAARSLLKLYDQKYGPERSIQFLQTLIQQNEARSFSLLPGDPPTVLTASDKSDQAVRLMYQRDLIERLYQQKRWTDVYTLGLVLLESLQPESDPGAEKELGYFVQAAHQQAKGMISRDAFLALPGVQKLSALYTERLRVDPAALTPRLNLLLLNPLAEVPPMPEAVARNSQNLPTLVEIFYLQGQWQDLDKALAAFMAPGSGFSPDEQLKVAQSLYLLGDYQAARQLTEKLHAQQGGTPELTAAITVLDKEIQTARKAADEQWTALRMLPRHIPQGHWAKTAEETLRVSVGNAKVHGFVADTLMAQKRPEEALYQQKLAARYAVSPRDRNYWLKKVKKTELSLEKLSKTKPSVMRPQLKLSAGKGL